MNTRAALLLLALVAGCSKKEQYGYLATLGNDTISVERITRTKNHIVSEVVEKSPRVIRKHWEVSFHPDGTIDTWTLDKDVANPGTGEAKHAHYEATFTRDSVIVIGRNGRQQQAAVIKDTRAVTVPWESYVYGNYELLFELAMKQAGDSVPVAQLQPGYGRFGTGLVRKQADGTVTFVTTGLAGTGMARLDSAGRMLSYSGEHTTYKQDVAKLFTPPDIDAITARFAKTEREHPVASLSPRDTTRGKIGDARIAVDYSRPLRRGRDILGNVVPYDAVWRTGANKATHLTTSAPIVIGGKMVPAGVYTIWTLPSRDSVLLIINRQTGQWGTRYNPRLDWVRVKMNRELLGTPVDTFTISLLSDELVMRWDTFLWSIGLSPAS